MSANRTIITFSGAAYDNTTAKIAAAAKEQGLGLRVYDDRWLLDSEFYRLNAEWWTKPDTKYNLPNRGFGWFIWKPYVILHALEQAQAGDVILYTDADTYPIADLAPIFERCEQERIVLFRAEGCQHQHWCKRDQFIVMGQDEDRWRFTQHAVARFMLFKKGTWEVQQFLMEWLTYCLNPLANTFDVSRILPGFDCEPPENGSDTRGKEYFDLREPRCEQAILTNLAHKYGVPLYREACQAGSATVGIEDTWFPQLFHQDGNCGDKGELQGSAFRNL